MKIIKINLQKIKNSEIKIISDYLKNGKVAALPFDTSYGLCANSNNKKAVRRIYQIKKRKTNIPLSSVFKSISEINKYCQVNKEQEKFLNKKLPGKYTIVLKAKPKTKIYTKYKNTISIRIPKNILIQKIAENFNKPFTATSANISGQPAAFSANKLEKQFQNKKNKPDLIIDSGPLKKTNPSKIVDLTSKKPVCIKRS